MNLRSLLLPGLASLVAAPLAVLSISAQADSNIPDARYFEDQLNDFMNIHDFEFRGRIVDFENEREKKIKKDEKKRGATALGTQLNFMSGWYKDVLGFNASLYTVGDLHSPYANNRGLLLASNCHTVNGNKFCNHTGFSKLGQGYVKARIPGDDVKHPLLVLKAGRSQIFRGLISGSGSRAVPSSWQGADLAGEFSGLNYGFAYVDKVSDRNSSNFEKVQAFNGKEIKNIWGLELGYKLAGFDLSYRDAHAKNFIKSFNVNAGYKFDFSPENNLGLNLVYFKAKKDGSLWDAKASNSYFKSDADVKHANLEGNFFGFDALVGYTKTSAAPKDKTMLGSYYYDFGENGAYGEFDVPTSIQIGDFMYDNEKAFVVNLGYDFKDSAPGLAAKVTYVEGKDFKKDNMKGKEKETDFALSYKFQMLALNGLSLTAKYAKYTPSGIDASFKSNKTTDRRLYLDYKAMIF